MATELANTPASSSKQAAQAKPKGLLRLLCAGRSKLQNNRLFTLSPNQPGFYVEPQNVESNGYKMKKRKTFRFSSFRWGAVGETRTRTGLLPLPPQSSVSTISPPPLCFGIAKVRTIFKLPNLFAKIFNFFALFSFFRQNAILILYIREEAKKLVKYWKCEI